ncbi:hypothetical protein MD484_g7658, partial [Candolleomyces efflorescens]
MPLQTACILCENMVLPLGFLVLALVLWTTGVIDTNIATPQQDGICQTSVTTTTGAALDQKDLLDAATEDLRLLKRLLSAAQDELCANGYLIESLSEERNASQSLSSALKTKVGKQEEIIVKNMARLARSDAQVRSLTRKNGECKADLATMRGVIHAQKAIIQQLQVRPSQNVADHADTSREGEEENQIDCIRSLLDRNMHLESSLLSTQESLAQRDAAIDRLTDRQVQQEAQRLAQSQENEKLKHLCTSLKETIRENEEAMARLRIIIAKEKTATEELKTLFTLSRAQPHIQGAAALSTVGIFEAQNRKIAELEEKLSECHTQLLLASERSGILLPFGILPFDGPRNGSSDSAPI